MSVCLRPEFPLPSRCCLLYCIALPLLCGLVMCASLSLRFYYLFSASDTSHDSYCHTFIHTYVHIYLQQVKEVSGVSVAPKGGHWMAPRERLFYHLFIIAVCIWFMLRDNVVVVAKKYCCSMQFFKHHRFVAIFHVIFHLCFVAFMYPFIYFDFIYIYFSVALGKKY